MMSGIGIEKVCESNKCE